MSAAHARISTTDKRADREAVREYLAATSTEARVLGERRRTIE